MGRSNGYRPKAAVRTEVLALRAKLAECRDDQWVKASMIMDNITTLLGYSGGPMHGKIEPRACKYCKYYGHTRQYCPKFKAAKERQLQREYEAILEEDQALFDQHREPVKVAPYDPTKGGQALTFDELGMPYTINTHCGAIVGVRGDRHYGKWTFDEMGRVVARLNPEPQPAQQSSQVDPQ